MRPLWTSRALTAGTGRLTERIAQAAEIGLVRYIVAVRIGIVDAHGAELTAKNSWSI